MTNFGTAILVAGASLALSGAPAMAQGSEIIGTFSRSDLEVALRANDAKWEAHPDNNSIKVIFSNGFHANAALMACEDSDILENCYGTSILATFAPPENASPADIAEAVSAYNYRQNFGRAYVDPEGALSVRIYIISDGGITRENYRRQIELWSMSLEKLYGYFDSAE